jgi:hypothetical protein
VRTEVCRKVRESPALPHAEAEGPPFTKLAASFYM